MGMDPHTLLITVPSRKFFFEIYVARVFYSTPLIVDYAKSYFNTVVNFNQNINLYANWGVNSKIITPLQL